MTRAKYMTFQVVYKALGFLIDFLKSYSKSTVKKARKKDLQESDVYNFEKIELNASSKYKDSLIGDSAKEQESEYKHLFQKYDTFYYSIYAVAYILTHNCETFVSNARYEEYQDFVALLVKYNSFFKTLKFFPKAFLFKLKEAQKKFNDKNDTLENLLKEELQEIEIEEKNDEWRGDIFMEDYLPFDPNFLNRSKKYLIPSYNFIGNESEEGEKTEENIDEKNLNRENNVNQERVIYDTLDDVSDVMSSWSKHETDDSNEHSKNLRTTPSRKSSILEGLDRKEKKIKLNQPSEFLSKPVIGK